MRCIDAQGTDAEAGLFPVQFFLALQHLHNAGVEVGVLWAPQSRAVHAVPEGDGPAFAGLEQEVLPVGEHRRAMEAQRQVTDMTNALLQKNADMLHMASVETAKESERGIVDMETLKHTNEQLISTLDEVLQIQTDGAKKRQEAEVELRRLEGELKQKLLQPRS